MINNQIADAIIAKARFEKQNIDKPQHAFRDSYNQPLGYHVFTVAAAIAPDHFFPYDVRIENASDALTIRNYLLESCE